MKISPGFNSTSLQFTDYRSTVYSVQSKSFGKLQPPMTRVGIEPTTLKLPHSTSSHKVIAGLELSLVKGHSNVPLVTDT